MAVSLIMIFFLLLIGAMFVTGDITTTVTTVSTLAVLLSIAGLSLWQMTKLLQRDE